MMRGRGIKRAEPGLADIPECNIVKDDSIYKTEDAF